MQNHDPSFFMCKMELLFLREYTSSCLLSRMSEGLLLDGAHLTIEVELSKDSYLSFC